MGQAKRRGNFQERRQQAIQAGRAKPASKNEQIQQLQAKTQELGGQVNALMNMLAMAIKNNDGKLTITGLQKCPPDQPPPQIYANFSEDKDEVTLTTPSLSPEDIL